MEVQPKNIGDPAGSLESTYAGTSEGSFPIMPSVSFKADCITFISRGASLDGGRKSAGSTSPGLSCFPIFAIFFPFLRGLVVRALFGGGEPPTAEVLGVDHKVLTEAPELEVPAPSA